MGALGECPPRGWWERTTPGPQEEKVVWGLGQSWSRTDAAWPGGVYCNHPSNAGRTKAPALWTES